MLKKLPINLSQSSLTKALDEIKFKKLLIEPGCLIHFSSVAEAELGKQVLKAELGCDVRFLLLVTSLLLSYASLAKHTQSHIVNTTMPSLMLQNLPATVTAGVLQESFSSCQPQFVRIIGAPSYQVLASYAK